MSQLFHGPAYSPDMSPIEHVWNALDLRVQQRAPVLTNIQQLRTAIEEEWDNIPQAKINSLINSAPTFFVFIAVCDQQMHICIPRHVKSID